RTRKETWASPCFAAAGPAILDTSLASATTPPERGGFARRPAGAMGQPTASGGLPDVPTPLAPDEHLGGGRIHAAGRRRAHRYRAAIRPRWTVIEDQLEGRIRERRWRARNGLAAGVSRPSPDFQSRRPRSD